MATRATPIQLLRSQIPNKRPDPALLLPGQPAVNISPTDPGLYIADSSAGLVKIGPTYVGPVAPNTGAVPPGAVGNSAGEMWLDTAGTDPVLKVFDGVVWVASSSGAIKEYANLAAFPAVGAVDTIYIADDTNLTYRWDSGASAYVLVGDGANSVQEFADLASFPAAGAPDVIYVADDTNLIYRWDATAPGYVQVGGGQPSVIEYPDSSGFPAVGVIDTIYVAQDTNTTYRYDPTLPGYAVIGSQNVQDYVDKSFFPATGVVNTLYIDDTTGVGYRWDAGTSTYEPVNQVEQPYIVYVSTWGDDTNSGGNSSLPKKTISAAIASLPPVTEDLYYVIEISPGVYEETCPMVVPRNVAIMGTNLRSVEIRPTLATNTETIFKVDSGFYCTGVTFSRHQSSLPASQAWCVAFNENADNRTISGVTTLGAYITRSPYIWNCTSLTAKQKVPLTTPWAQGGSLSVGATGGGFLVDGNSCVKQSPLRSMVVAAFTQVNLQGPGARITNNGYAQLVSFFTTFCTTGVECFNGGQANLETCTTDFGDEGLVADGYSATDCFSATSNGAYFGGSRIDTAAIADVATDTITLTYPTAAKFADGDQVVMQATSGTVPSPLLIGQPYYVINANSVANTIQLSATSGGPLIDLTAAPDPFQVIRQGVLQIKVNTPTAGVGWFGSSTRPYDGMLMIQTSGVNTYFYDVLSSAQDLPGTGYIINFFSQTNGGLIAPLANGDTLSFRLRSQMTATGHTFEYVGSGTNYSAMPYNGGAPDTTKYVIQSNQGRVFWSGTDQRGTFSVGTQFMVDGLTGEVTIDASTFNVSGLNFIGPFSRNGGISTVGVQMQELSNDFNLRSSLGVPDGNTAPTQLAVFEYVNNNAAPYQVTTVAPTTRPDGNALEVGDMYYNSVTGLQFTYKGTGWAQNFVGPFSRNGGVSTVGVQLQELSNDNNLESSLGVPDGNAAPTQLAVFNYVNSNAAPYQVKATDPTTRADGNPLQVGDLYYNSATGVISSYNGVAWVAPPTATTPIATATTVGTMKTGTASVTALAIAVDGTVNVTINSLPTLP